MSDIIKEYTTGFVTSKDRTKIGYRQVGTGPAVILVHGALMTAQNFTKLARYLSSDFTVFVPDRQGRASSGTRQTNLGLRKEAEDIQALVEKTHAENIFGLSSGAIITLQTAINIPTLRKIALYEPPIPINSTIHNDWYATYEQSISKNNFGSAFISILKGTTDASFFTKLPSFITAPLMNLAIKRQAKNPKQDEMLFSALIKTFSYDYKVMRESEGIIEQAKSLNAVVLLLGGTKSQQYLRDVLDKLMDALPHAKKIIFPGLGHTAADNGGKPEIVQRN